MAETQAVLQELCMGPREVSAHYVISPHGDVIQLVYDTERAWHAGVASWGEEADVNSRSIGIELVNDGQTPFAAPQMAALEALLPVLMARWDIPAKGVIAHSDVAPGRKYDPGPRFDWQRLARLGLSIWPVPLPFEACTDTFYMSLATAGYTADVPRDVLLDAFRLRFRPRAHGPLTPDDMALAAGLAKDFPVDPARRKA